MTRDAIHHSERLPLMTRTPDFLHLSLRTAKPRCLGISHVLDHGLSLGETAERLEAAAASIDIWKFGWGTAYIDPALTEKLALIKTSGVRACPGGTLLEIAWLQGVVPQFLDWAESVGFDCVEVSCGSVHMPRDVKTALISQAADRFTVLAEVGTKDPEVEVLAEQWCADARSDLAAGATWIVSEGRASGTVGLFERDGSIRSTLVDALVAEVGLEQLLFEAPQRAQQAWLIRHHGANVNLGNIDPSAALSVESLRLGLRSDTLATHDPQATTETP